MYSLVLMAALTSGGDAPAFFPHVATPYLPVYQAPPPSTFYGFHTGSYTGTAMAGNGFGACYGCCGGGGCIGGAAMLSGTGGYGIPQSTLMNPVPSGPAKDPGKDKVVPDEKKDKVVPDGKKDKVGPDDKKTGGASVAPGTARVVVALPADARLFANGQPTRSTAAVRTFLTPELAPGAVYAYTLRAEMVVDGKAVTQTRRIVLRAGAEVHARFDDPRLVATARER